MEKLIYAFHEWYLETILGLDVPLYLTAILSVWLKAQLYPKMHLFSPIKIK